MVLDATEEASKITKKIFKKFNPYKVFRGLERQFCGLSGETRKQ